MPELPEVEVILQKIKKKIINKKILYIVVRCKKLRMPISKEIYEIKNEKILQITRKSKYLIIKISKGYILIHFGMSGTLLFFSKKENIIFNKHDHIDFVLNKNILRYNDHRKFGLCLWIKNLKHKFLKNLGPEPFNKNFNKNYLFTKTRKIKKPIKTFIMQNKVVSGVGNIYANESLFASGILPYRNSLSLTKKECCILVKKIKKILLHSIKKGGTTLKNFYTPDGSIGNFQKELKVYNRFKQPCIKCDNLINCIKQENRKTYFCIYCQK